MRRTIFLIFCAAMLLCGCATTQGAGKGLAKDAGNFWQAMKNADAWLQKHLW